MKYMAFGFVLVFMFLQGSAQDKVKYLSHGEIKVGNRMPDIPLGEVMNNYTGKRSFSEFKGKLVILDFWDSWCSPCIKGFVEMSALQKEFGNEIQIILVNYLETGQAVSARLGKLGKTIPANLPSIVNAKALGRLFPPKAGIGYHVWINPDGIVCLRGPGILDTYEDKIRDFLAGKKIDFIKDGDPFDKNKPLYTVIGGKSNPVLQYNSLFTGFNDEIGEAWGNNLVNIQDSGSRTIRSTFTNTTALDLCNVAAHADIYDDKVLWGKKILLLVTDTLRYTDAPALYSVPYISPRYRFKSASIYFQRITSGIESGNICS